MAGLRLDMPIGIAAGGRPAAACEITPTGVIAAATPSTGQPPVYAAESLAAFTVAPGLAEGNLTNLTAVSAAIRAALEQVKPRVKSVTVVVPDSAVRVFMLDFDTLPAKADETLTVLRFRLRKSVPFDVETAAISHQVLSEGSAKLDTQWKVLATIMPGPVLAEYEAAVRSAGYEPGVVLPSSLAMLAAIDSTEAILAVNLSAQSLATTIVSGNDILLYRTVELPADPYEQQIDVQRAIAVAAAFYEDKLHMRPHRVLYAGAMPVKDFVLMLDDAELAVHEVVERPETGIVSSLGDHPIAAVTGALAGTN